MLSFFDHFKAYKLLIRIFKIYLSLYLNISHLPKKWIYVISNIIQLTILYSLRHPFLFIWHYYFHGIERLRGSANPIKHPCRQIIGGSCRGSGTRNYALIFDRVAHRFAAYRSAARNIRCGARWTGRAMASEVCAAEPSRRRYRYLGPNRRWSILPYRF